MASKQYGTTRMVTPTSKEFARRNSEFAKSLMNSNNDASMSYFSQKGGGYLLFDKDRKYDTYEYQAAKYLADSGYIVHMTPEKGAMYVTAHYNGKDKFSDGKIFGVTYEQKTPEPKGADFNRNVTSAIEHAKDKGSKIALIYDAHDYLHRYNISKGMDDYKKFHGHSRYDTVERVIVVNAKGKVYEWEF